MTTLLQRLHDELVRRNYAATTIRTYLQHFVTRVASTAAVASIGSAAPSSGATTCSSSRSDSSPWGPWSLHVCALRFFLPGPQAARR